MTENEGTTAGFRGVASLLAFSEACTGISGFFEVWGLGFRVLSIPALAIDGSINGEFLFVARGG